MYVDYKNNIKFQNPGIVCSLSTDHRGIRGRITTQFSEMEKCRRIPKFRFFIPATKR